MRSFLRFATPIVAALLVVVAVAGCSDSDPPTAAEPTASDDLGAIVYANNCASCHGADLRGTDEGPSQLSIVYEPNHHPDAAYRTAIANGTPQHHWNFGDMPPVEGLSDSEVEAVIGWVRSEQQRQGFQR